RFGQGFHLFEAGAAPSVFAAFGDVGRANNRFAAAADGIFVIAPGTYGVIGWKRDGGRWAEAWAIDYWKEFARLDWPVSDVAERVPQFHALIPPGADHAVVLFGELSNNGWVKPEQHGGAWLAAVRLADGRELWRFPVPIPKSLVFPELHASPDGRQLLVQAQVGSWGSETFRFFRVADGRALGSWDAKSPPLAVALADHGGLSAVAYQDRLVDVRRTDGKPLYNLTWPANPVSLAFAADGSGLFVADDAGVLTRLDLDGKELWRADLG